MIAGSALLGLPTSCAAGCEHAAAAPHHQAWGLGHAPQHAPHLDASDAGSADITSPRPPTFDHGATSVATNTTCEGGNGSIHGVPGCGRAWGLAGRRHGASSVAQAAKSCVASARPGRAGRSRVTRQGCISCSCRQSAWQAGTAQHPPGAAPAPSQSPLGSCAPPPCSRGSGSAAMPAGATSWLVLLARAGRGRQMSREAAGGWCRARTGATSAFPGGHARVPQPACRRVQKPHRLNGTAVLLRYKCVKMRHAMAPGPCGVRRGSARWGESQLARPPFSRHDVAERTPGNPLLGSPLRARAVLGPAPRVRARACALRIDYRACR